MSEERENLKRLQKQFHSDFAARMLRYGFNRHGGGMNYEKTEFGRKGVMILDYLRYGSLQISANMTVTLTDVEALLFEYRTKASEATDIKKPEIQTISQNLGNIKIGIFRQWSNYNEGHVVETVAEIDELIRLCGLSFLQTVDSPEKVLTEMLATTKGKTKLGHPTFWYEKAFALMLLQNRRDLFDEYSPIFERYERLKGAVSLGFFTNYRDWIIEKWSAN